MNMMTGPPDTAVINAVFYMTRGATMLKAGRKGRPHYRNFMLSRDLTSLQWQSPRKDTDKSVVHISQITELLKGQKTKVFEACILLHHVEPLSFSIVYKVSQSDQRTLDIVCCEKAQFETWTKGLEALIAGFNGKKAVDDLYHNNDQTDLPNPIKLEFGPMGKTILQYLEDAFEMYTWGEGTKGMLGHGDDIEENQPRILEALIGRDIKHVACGTTHTIAVAKSGEVFSWGSGYGGKLGQGHLRDRFSPLRIESLKEKQIVRVACHELHSAALSVEGELYTWGKSGPWLGYQGASGKQLSPRLVEGLGDDNKGATVDCGLKHTVVCTTSGKVFAFGDNEFGQLGLDGLNQSYIPLHVESLARHSIVQVACGTFHSAVRSKLGSMWLWGNNKFGQLGAGNLESTSKPFHISSVPDFRNTFISDVSCGAQHSAFVVGRKSKKNEVYCMGSNSDFQLGVRSGQPLEKHNLTYSCPVQVLFNSDAAAVQVSCGEAHTALVTASGELFTWGRGKGGRLGHSDSRDRPLPCEIDSMEGKRVCVVACGGSHTTCMIARAWVPDDEIKNCIACRLKFGLNRKRHHCRRCRGVFCNLCSSKKTPILARGYSNLVRVCDKCYSILSENM